jgi:NitT/TauT family transport system substrate-binding protein
MRIGSVMPRVRVAAAAVLVAAACSGCAAADGSRGGEVTNAPLTKVSFIGVKEQGAAGYAAAHVQGAFTEQGLDFSPTWATSGSVILQGVVGGDFDIGNVGPAQLYAAIENGVCARVLRPTEGAAYGLIARPDLHFDVNRPFPDVLRQLKGARIGVAARGAAQELVLRTLLKEAGLDANTDVTWLAIGSTATALAAFTSGQVDVAMSYTQLEVSLHAAGAGFDKLLVLAGPNTPLGVFWQAVAIANCDWADSHPDTVMRFCHALNQGFAALVNDQDAGPKAFAYVEIGSDLAESAALWETYKAPTVDIPPLTEQNWRFQSRFTPNNYTPDFSRHVVAGCATA